MRKAALKSPSCWMHSIKSLQSSPNHKPIVPGLVWPLPSPRFPQAMPGIPASARRSMQSRRINSIQLDRCKWQRVHSMAMRGSTCQSCSRWFRRFRPWPGRKWPLQVRNSVVIFPSYLAAKHMDNCDAPTGIAWFRTSDVAHWE